MIKHVKGDLLKMFEEKKFGIICHGCNCFNTMGAGIAAQIRQKYPKVYATDCETDCGDKTKLGHIIPVPVAPRQAIINMYTQYTFNCYGKVVYPLFSYWAFHEGLKTIKRLYGKLNKRIAFPKIGAGLAGGDWKIIEALIEQELGNLDITIVEYKP